MEQLGLENIRVCEGFLLKEKKIKKVERRHLPTLLVFVRGL
mgnify:CR=1 FL=1